MGGLRRHQLKYRNAAVLSNRPIKKEKEKKKKKSKPKESINLGHIPDFYEEWEVHVKTLTGRLVTVLVHPYDTIQQLRSKVAMKEGISVDQIILLMNGLHLDDGTFLREWNIGNGTVLFMTFRLRGG